MSAPYFVYSNHALDNLTIRDIERSWVERTVMAPDETEPDPKYPERTRAFREVPECGGRILRVVYVRDGETIRIVTVFLDRGRRRAQRAGQLRP